MSPGPGRFSRLTDWAHLCLDEVLAPGDLAVDLTAGNGHDTLFLWQRVANGGRVLAFDLQETALQNTALRLRKVHSPVYFCGQRQVPSTLAGVHLIADGHEQLANYVYQAPRAVIANLGYLPGGDRQQVTRPSTTLGALQDALRLLAKGGRLAVTAYPRHPGGFEEAAAVAGFLQSLEPGDFEVLVWRVANSPEAPRLWVVQKNVDVCFADGGCCVDGSRPTDS